MAKAKRTKKTAAKKATAKKSAKKTTKKSAQGTAEQERESIERLETIRRLERSIINHRLRNYGARPAPHAGYDYGYDSGYDYDPFDPYNLYDGDWGAPQRPDSDTHALPFWGGQRDRIPLTVKMKPDGELTIKTDIQKNMHMDIQIRPGGRIEVQAGGTTRRVQAPRRKKGKNHNHSGYQDYDHHSEDGGYSPYMDFYGYKI